MSKLATAFITLTVHTLRATESIKMCSAALQGKRYIVATDQDGVTRVHVCR